LLRAGRNSGGNVVAAVQDKCGTGLALIVGGIDVHDQGGLLRAVHEYRDLGCVADAYDVGISGAISGASGQSDAAVDKVGGRIHDVRHGARQHRLAVLVKFRKLAGRLSEHNQGGSEQEARNSQPKILFHELPPQWIAVWDEVSERESRAAKL